MIWSKPTSMGQPETASTKHLVACKKAHVWKTAAMLHTTHFFASNGRLLEDRVIALSPQNERGTSTAARWRSI